MINIIRQISSHQYHQTDIIRQYHKISSQILAGKIKEEPNRWEISSDKYHQISPQISAGKIRNRGDVYHPQLFKSKLFVLSQ